MRLACNARISLLGYFGSFGLSLGRCLTLLSGSNITGTVLIIDASTVMLGFGNELKKFALALGLRTAVLRKRSQFFLKRLDVQRSVSRHLFLHGEGILKQSGLFDGGTRLLCVKVLA